MSAKYKWIYQKEYANINKLVLEHIKQKWEKLDKKLFKTRDKSKYKIIDYKSRTRKIKHGIVIYKRRIYEYYSIELQKWIRICLVDEELELPKYKRIGEDIEQIVIEYFAYGKRYRDICDILKNAGLTTMDIHRIFKKLKIVEAMVEKIILEANQPIYVAIDDGHRKFWDFKHKGNKYSMRLGTFYTDNVNHKLENKRVSIIIRKKTAIGVKKMLNLSKNKETNFLKILIKQKLLFVEIVQDELKMLQII